MTPLKLSLMLVTLLTALLIGERLAFAAPDPQPTPAATAPATLPEAPTPTVSSGTHATTGEVVNNMIDDLLAVGGRLLDLPLFMVLTAVAVITFVVALLIRALFKKSRASVSRVLFTALVVAFLFSITFIIDRKIARLQDAVSDLRTKASADAAERLAAISKLQQSAATAPASVATAQRQAFFFDPAEARKNLATPFGDVTLRPVIYDEAIDYVQVRSPNPLIQAYLTIIDLRHPGLQIKLGGTLDHKTLTSDFARQNACTVAINGEAGSSPEEGSGLGVWRGNMVRLGQVLFREDPKIPRPYLSFDPKNHAVFTPAAATDRTLAADSHNVIWGRLDALIDGVVQTADERYRQPRTAMAINKDATRLYLLVIDGRQPRYSMGFTRAEVGQCLKAFGAYNGMLCDEGGSSCMYLKEFGGITNIPSDNQGQERPTYTHFGISLQSANITASH